MTRSQRKTKGRFQEDVDPKRRKAAALRTPRPKVVVAVDFRTAYSGISVMVTGGFSFHWNRFARTLTGIICRDKDLSTELTHTWFSAWGESGIIRKKVRASWCLLRFETIISLHWGTGFG
ncbi:hypothetical protein R1sor_026149 [Riccia sorocarpa]|uniref:Uncharacterized protein n=1 Tax=Riccia sorocarpa TaxID=122646 RepID=A0ABD3GC60_9MARC